MKPRLTLAYKQRVPNAVERHSWMPTEASDGSADGNIFVGDGNLKGEKAWIAEAGVAVGQRSPMAGRSANVRMKNIF